MSKSTWNESQATLKRALKYLSSGSAEVWAPSTTSTTSDPNESGEISSIALLQDEFGTPNSLESDIAYLWETSTLADCRLTFNYSSHPDKVSPELLCHRTILAARSGFFRRLIERRVKADPSLSSSVLDICLDGSIVPAKFGRLLLHAMYHDTLVRTCKKTVQCGSENRAFEIQIHLKSELFCGRFQMLKSLVFKCPYFEWFSKTVLYVKTK